MMRSALPLALAALLCAAAPALAAAEDSEALFNAGQFAAAADAGKTENTADSLARSANATLVIAAYKIEGKDKALSLIAEAEARADAALQKKPGHVDATLQKAIAIGYRAKFSRSPGLAKQARRLMEEAAARAPRSAFAHAVIGGWHGEAISEFGRFLAGTLVGAKRKESIAAFEKSLRLDPANPAHRTLYAVSLIGMGRADAEKLSALLTPAAKGRGGDGFERLMRARARALLIALESGDAGQLERAAERARPFATLR